MTPVDLVISRFGSQSEVARVLAVTQPTIWQWKRRGIIPARHQRAILLAARERGLDITAEDLIGVERSTDGEAA